MRAIFDSPIIDTGPYIVYGIVPATESLEFPIKVRSITAERGVWTTSFAG